MVSLVSAPGPAVMLVTGGAEVRPGPAHHGELVGVRRLVGVAGRIRGGYRERVGALGQAVVGEEQLAGGSESIWQLKLEPGSFELNWNVGVESAVSAPGSAVIVVCGGVVSGISSNEALTARFALIARAEQPRSRCSRRSSRRRPSRAPGWRSA